MYTFLTKKRKGGMRRGGGARGGFFLAELIVAVSIFGLVMTVSVGSLVLALDANRKSQSLKSVLNNLNIALDSMTRAIATGSHLYCGFPGSFDPDMPELSDCYLQNIQTPETIQGVTFLSNEDLDGNGVHDDFVFYAFSIDPNDATKGYISRTVYSEYGTVVSDSIRMTAPEVDIDSVRFYVTGVATVNDGTHEQPKATIIINGTMPGPRDTGTQFTVQTTVSQRNPDLR